MVKTPLEAHCKICNALCPLSFEHIPPKSAFNNRPVYRKSLAELARDENPLNSGPKSQKGYGERTICIRCNNNTGAWYGSAYADFAEQGMSALKRIDREVNISQRYYIRPLNVLKQIITIFFSVNSPSITVNYPTLTKFVLNRRDRSLDPRIGIYAYINRSSLFRQSAEALLTNPTTGFTSFFSEFTFPPWGFVMTFDSEPPNKKMCKLNPFVTALYDEPCELFLVVPVLSIASPLPGKY